MPQFQTHQDQFIESSAELLDCMSSAHRLEILTILSEREMSVRVLSRKVGLTSSALSQQLAKLRNGGLVVYRREAQKVFYRCESPSVKRVLATLAELFPAGEVSSVSGNTILPGRP